MEYIHLVGVEQVQTAAERMVEAAERMNTAANMMSEALHIHGLIMIEVMQELNRLETAGDGTGQHIKE